MNDRLLLIDDDARLAAMVGDYLRGHGFEVDCAPSLAAGRERLARGAYDALLSRDHPTAAGLTATFTFLLLPAVVWYREEISGEL